ncbi:MAG TPA: thioredoxin fold domain-containing protein, partial [Planctomycetaceae bacterium]|nr:thioredoxin fold domain-containing protein [Planctomycetaceae bacterium]
MHHRTCLLVIAVCMALSSTPARASKLKWQTDLQQAIHESDRSKKPLLVEFTASWCGYCRKMKQTTFADERIARHVNGCFVPVSIDADENQRLLQRVGVDALPTTVLLSRDLRVVRKIAGYQTPEQFEEHLATVCRHEDTQFTAVSDASPAPVPQAVPEMLAAAAQPPTFAFDRLCLVSLRDDHRLRTGLESCSAEYRGRRVCFASPEHQRRFEQNPEHYWPMLDGRC